MPPRSIWNGAVAFGAVNVPIKVFGALEDKAIRFRELHSKDGSEVGHRLIDNDGKEVPRDRVVKGFEVGNDEYVVLSDDELVDPEKLDVDTPSKKPGKREIDMAGMLVETLAAKFEPERYEDTYRERVLAVVKAKEEGEEISIPEPEAPDDDDNLMAALEASLKA